MHLCVCIPVWVRASGWQGVSGSRAWLKKKVTKYNKITKNTTNKGGIAAKRLLPLPLHPFGRFCCRRRVVFVIFTTAPETNSCLSHNDLNSASSRPSSFSFCRAFMFGPRSCSACQKKNREKNPEKV